MTQQVLGLCTKKGGGMLKHIAIVLGGFVLMSGYTTLGLASNDFAQNYTISCGDPELVHQLVMQGEHLPVTYSRQCKILLNRAGSITALNSRYLNQMYTDTKIRVGPISETFRQLPSDYFEVTYRDVSEAQTTEMELKAHVATNDLTQVIRAVSATHVSGTGDAVFLRDFSAEQVVTKDPSSGQVFYFSETQSILIEEPWYAKLAPVSLFMMGCSSQFKNQFIKYTNTNVEFVAKGLLN